MKLSGKAKSTWQKIIDWAFSDDTAQPVMHLKTRRAEISSAMLVGGKAVEVPAFRGIICELTDSARHPALSTHTTHGDN